MENHAEVLDFPELRQTTKYEDETPNHDPENSHKRTSNRRLFVIGIILVVLMTAGYFWFLNGESQSEQIVADQPTVEQLQVLLSESDAQISALSAEIFDQDDQISSLQAAIDNSVPYAAHNQLQSEMTELVAEQQTLKAELAQQLEVSTQLQSELDKANQTQVQTEQALESARAETAQQSSRANLAEATLATELGYLPDRMQGALQLMASFELLEGHYHLGEVVYELKRPGIWDDETQFFWGNGDIGLQSGLQQAHVSWQEESLEVILPLPRITPWQLAQIEGKTDTEREQFARIGGRWGDQTEWFVDDVAKQETHSRACSDVALLRRGMETLEKIARELSLGHQIQIVWTDQTGTRYSNVSDQVLLDNAC